MHIVVAVKQVYDPSARPDLLRIGADARSLEPPPGISPVMNGYDANAIEAAIKLKERSGGSITAISVGDEPAKNSLRRAIAMGADQAVLIQGEAGLGCDATITAKLLAAAIRKLGPADLVLCGRQASDTDAGVVPFLLAEELELAAISPVRALDITHDASAIVERIGDGCFQRIAVALPALVCVSNEINKPRPASLRGVMLSKKAAIPTWTLTDLGVDALEPAMTLRRLRIAPSRQVETEIIVASDAQSAGIALADRLRLEGLI